MYIVYIHILPRVCLSTVMLDPHLSAMLWMGVVASLIIVLVMPQPLSVRALVIITILRLIFSVGLEPTLFLLGAFNVSILPRRVAFLSINAKVTDHFPLFCCYYSLKEHKKRNLKKLK